MLSAAEITAMRATVELTMVNRAVVLRQPPGDPSGSDEFGSPGESAATPKTPVLTDIPVRVTLAQRAGAEGIAAARLENRLPWTLAFPALTDVRPHDAVTVGSRRFEVIEVLGPESVELERRVLAEEVL